MSKKYRFNFSMFVALWNQDQGIRTPDVHFRITQWLEDKWFSQDRQLLLMAFRSCGKSTLSGLFCAWLFYQNPDLRILVMAADSILARKMVRNVKRVLERHPLTIHLKPRRPDQWAGDRFTVERSSELRDPSMLGRGITSNITGSRADIIIYDDVEVPNTCDTADKREELRTRLAEIEYVLVPGGLQLYIGTPHSYYTIYAAYARTEIGEEYPFLNGFKRLEIPIENEKGESQWPGRFSKKEIESIKKRTGPNKFASQMMLQPVNIANSRLDPDQIPLYPNVLEYHESRRIPQLYLADTKLVSASAWWDPSFARSSGDNSVFAAVYSDAQGRHYLQHIEYIDPCNKFEDSQDEASRQCSIIARLANELFLPVIAVEINGIGRFLPGILRRELARLNVPCAVREISNRRPKHLRILEAFDVVLAAKALHAHENTAKTPFFQEMRAWRPGNEKSSDDGLDAVAGALSLEPVRFCSKAVGPHYWTRRLWQGCAADYKANTQFTP